MRSGVLIMSVGLLLGCGKADAPDTINVVMDGVERTCIATEATQDPVTAPSPTPKKKCKH